MNREPKKPGSAYRQKTTPVETTETTTHTELPTETTTEQALAREKTKRRSRPLLVALLSLLLIGLGAAAALYAYKMYEPIPATDTDQETATQTEPKNNVLTAKQVIERVAKDYEKSDPDLVQPIKVAGYDYYVSAKADNSVKKSVAYNESSVETASIARELKAMDFSEKVTQAGDESTDTITDYAHSDVVCRLITTRTYHNPTGNHIVNLNCEDMSTISKLAEQYKDFYAVLPKENSEGVTTAFFGAPAIEASKTEGYHRATLGVGGVIDGKAGPGGVAQLFYKTPDGKWHYLTGTQQLVFCDRFDTADKKKAYLGERCYDRNSDKESTVSL